MSSQRQIAGWFARGYSTMGTDVHAQVQREVFGGEAWVRGYTTPAQADLLAERLGLRPGVRLLDVGAGEGWPSLYLAKKTGCDSLLTDVPEPGLRNALKRSHRDGLGDRCSFVLASGTRLPFAPHTFDAVIHTDAL